MKNIFILLLFFVQTSFAQLIMVTHTNGTSTSYTDLYIANSNFQDGDYVYLSGGTFTINNAIIINKKVHIIGAGHNPDSTIATGVTIISKQGTANAIDFGLNSDGSSIEGITINSGHSLSVGYSLSNPIDSIVISRCKFDNLSLTDGVNNPLSTNILVKECIITSTFNCAGNNGGFFKNNIFNCSITGAALGCHFENNIFLSTNINLTNLASSFKYNIFISTNAVTGFAGNSFISNVFSSPTSINDISFALSSSGDSLNQNPSTICSVNLSSIPPFTYNLDFTIPNGSPAHLIDGVTDAGIYAGTFPWKAGSVPYNPHIFNATIPGAVDVNGMLNINIKVAGQDH